ncbi:hypothetical protein [Drosophila suzukii associated hytrosavirus 1]|nr:hypothetical protein [Drosophila suzukii associated hytrosavirus 1]
MSENIHVSALSSYLRQLYGKRTTNKLLLRVFIIEKKLKYMDYDTINTNEYFFLLYFVIRHVVEYLQLALKNGLKYLSLEPVNVIELSSYLVYSYFGPSVEYTFNMFVARCKDPTDIIDWKDLILNFLLNSEFSYKMIALNSDTTYLQHELERFLALV